MIIRDNYGVYYKETCIGLICVFTDGRIEYRALTYQFDDLKEEKIPAHWKRSVGAAKTIPFLSALMTEDNRVKGTRKTVYRQGDYSVVRRPEKTADRFWVYRRNASPGEKGYSKKEYTAPHSEGSNSPDGMKEWVSWYCFIRMDDGTYEAELDEAWCWGGGHNDGGTMDREIPEEWFSLPWNGFLENIVTLARASHYGFTAAELNDKTGLKEFFGFADS